MSGIISSNDQTLTPSEAIEPGKYLFVFTDDLSVHRSLRDAAAYHEYREPLRAFDEQGNCFTIPQEMHKEPVRQPGDYRQELIRRLRGQLIGLAIARPETVQMTKWEVKHAPDKQIVELAVQFFSIREPSNPWLLASASVSVLIVPVLMILLPLILLIRVGSKAVSGVKRLFARASTRRPHV